MYEVIRPGYLDSLAKSESWVDAIAIHGMARMIGRCVLILTSLKESTKLGYLVNNIQCGDSSSGDPLLLGNSVSTAAVVSPYFLATVWQQQQW